MPIHAPPGPDEDELANRTRAIEVGQDMAVRTVIIAVVQPSGVGGMIETVTNDPIFEFDIVRVDAARWLDIGQPGTRAVRHPGALGARADWATETSAASTPAPQGRSYWHAQINHSRNVVAIM